MKKYIVEDDLDFYKELNDINNITDVNEANENIGNICLITGLPLEKYNIKLICNHIFNYIPLYKDIYNSKFKINVLNTASSQYPSNKIKCPYCRSTQFKFLPYYKELELPLVYGINTNDVMFNIVKNKKNQFVYGNTMTYFAGECCFLDSDNQVCKNNMVLLHSESQKTYCFEHINYVKKTYTKQIKELKKQQKKEEMKIKKQQQKEELKLKKQQQKEEQKNQIIATSNIILCNQVLKTGINKGNSCKCKVFLLDKCKKHYKPLSIDNPILNDTTIFNDTIPPV